MKLTFIGADHEVTGSCHFISACGKNILIDYGMEQGKDYFENVPLPVSAPEIDYVFLTHAHVDHSGNLPLLYAKGFRGKIFTTDATADLCNIMLRDCAHIQMQEAEWRNRKAKRSKDIQQMEPSYTMEDAEKTIKMIIPCKYGDEIDVCEGVKIRFTDIGHLLGSASIEVWLTEKNVTKKIVFSGDIGNKEQPLIRDPQFTEEADYVVMESTYGDRLHSEERPDYIKDLTEILDRTFARGGNVVIPSFAVGRTQEMLYFIRKIKKEGLVKTNPNFPVYVDSPLAVEATEIFSQNQLECYDEEAMDLVKRHINPITFRELILSITTDESRAINEDPEPKVIISASGMCEAGRIRHHLKHNLWREESTILFVGYQSVGTTGRTIIDGADEIKLFGETIAVKAEICRLEGLSGHADKDGLIEWIQGFKKQRPKKVFIVHGEDSVCTSFANCLRDEYGFDTYAPYSGTEYDLISGTFIKEGVPIPIKKKESTLVSDVYSRLKAAGARLMGIIAKSDGLTNKDKAKFADQINSLCEKWMR
ncbi:MBL fold metallo-hydrolase RNA specificity domain-containing protein [Butyrivibrio sp. INlla21]|uniref:MBL fold metallo-hydrolase RNA specificity domain-containing protein n=1 Tax=Butyrivibrio sp. INlla21 TaxID=1520811 RepID=UPI0008E400CE|nr:MBL fold metallo-hydrolase [Butyrivibrio sp. INlla21]SFU93261.1 metallo-beta-lactamase family protein [Butyrivibrio sp. INlla21]